MSMGRFAVLLDSPGAWIAYYFFFNLGLTVFNKYILQNFNFHFGWVLTGIHALLSSLGAFVLVKGFGFAKLSNLSNKENLILLAFSVLYTVNIAVSNVSLDLVSLPLHQIVRSTNPVVTLVFEYLLGRNRASNELLASLVPVVIGVVIAVFGEIEFTAWGLFLTFFGVVLASIKGIVTNMLMVGSLKLHPLDLLLRMGPLAAAQCLIISLLSGEWGKMMEFFHNAGHGSGVESKIDSGESASAGTLAVHLILGSLLLNGACAFILNVVSFTANKKTSALAISVAGNVKQALSILMSVWLFDYIITSTNGLGIIITLIGGAWYSHVQLKENEAKKNAPKDQPLIPMANSTGVRSPKE